MLIIKQKNVMKLLLKRTFLFLIIAPVGELIRGGVLTSGGYGYDLLTFIKLIAFYFVIYVFVMLVYIFSSGMISNNRDDL
jgi:hypothetical protein